MHPDSADTTPSAPSATPRATPARAVLVVDMDGSLTPCNTLLETILHLLGQNVLLLARMLGWRFQGLPRFKAQIARRAILDPATLPYRPAVLELIAQARRDGQRVVLCSASHRRQVDAVASHLGLFDDCFGSDERVNLRGQRKAELLIARYGDRGYGYVGDSWRDVPVWASAGTVVTAGAGRRLRDAVAARHPGARHLAPAGGRGLALWELARAHRARQWLANLLLFAPPLFAQAWLDAPWTQLLGGFLAFSLASFGLGVVDDLADMQADREDAHARERPFAAGRAPVGAGLVAAATALAIALAASALWLAPGFFAVLGIYCALALAYSGGLKRWPLVDVLALSAACTLRIVAGGELLGSAINATLLAFSTLLFLVLAATRLALALAAPAPGRPVAGRGYAAGDQAFLRGLAAAAGLVALMTLMAYVDTAPGLAAGFGWTDGLCPLFALWLIVFLYRAQRAAGSVKDPFMRALRNPVGLLLAAAALAIALAAGPF